MIQIADKTGLVVQVLARVTEVGGREAVVRIMRTTAKHVSDCAEACQDAPVAGQHLDKIRG